MTYREAVRKLARLGCVENPRRSRGAHRKWRNPATNRSTVVSDHGGKDLKLGTVKGIVKQLGLDWADFEQA